MPDGAELLSSQDAARLIGAPQHTLHKWVERGYIHPARFGRELIFTRAQVVALRDATFDREIARLLQEGVPPLEIWTQLPNATPADVVRVLKSWARLAGVWIVEMPPGSYARWLARFKLTKFGAPQLRRAIERLLESGPG